MNSGLLGSEAADLRGEHAEVAASRCHVHVTAWHPREGIVLRLERVAE